MNTITGKHRILLREEGVWNSNTEFGSDNQLYPAMAVTGPDDADRAIIGAYNATTGARLTRTDFTEWGGSHTRPVISGDSNGDGIPDRTLGFYDPLVGIYSKNYVTIENIEITQSMGEGLRFYYSLYGYANKVKVSRTQGWGLLVTSQSHYGKAEYCDASYTSECMNIFGRRVTASDYGTGALGATVDSDYFEARYNVIHHSEGEGLGVYNFSDDAIVEFNKVYDNIRPNIYMSDILRPTVRYNLVFGTADTAYNGCSGCWSSGIGFAAEIEVSTAGYGKMYGNLIANQVQGGIFVWTSYITSPGHVVYNNTVVDCEPGIDLGDWGTGSLEVTMKNNAVNFVSTTGTLASY